MREFIEYIAKHLVDQPDGVVLEEETKEDKLVLKLKVAQGDVEKSSDATDALLRHCGCC